VKTSQFHKKILLYKESAGLSNCLISLVKARFTTDTIRFHFGSYDSEIDAYLHSKLFKKLATIMSQVESFRLIRACLQDTVTHKRKRACK
jgi:hypothetical protein